MTARPATIDEYLAGVRPEHRAALKRLRKSISASAPEAEECISYGLPAFRLDGRVLVYFGAAAKHCSFFPGSGTAVAAHAHLLKGYDTSKGTIRFQPGKPIPAALIRILVKARIDEFSTMQSKSRRPGKARRKRKDSYVAGAPDRSRARLLGRSK
jgi:uncharacterized protein YdhG (YjbR/CyaY superfamily)